MNPFLKTTEIESYNQLLKFVKNCPKNYDTTILLAFWESNKDDPKIKFTASYYDKKNFKYDSSMNSLVKNQLSFLKIM